MQNHTVIAVDVAKAVFEIAVSDRPGHVCRRARCPGPRCWSSSLRSQRLRW